MSRSPKRALRIFTVACVGALGVATTASVGADPLGEITPFSDGITLGSSPEGITTGPDGNLWFTEFFADNLGRITPDGVVTEFPLPTADAQARSITTGPDGNLWFTESAANNVAVADTTGNVLDEIDLTVAPACDGGICSPFDIVVGSDGNLWVTLRHGDQIARITPAGVLTKFDVPSCADCSPYGITAGPDGNLWFTTNEDDLVRTIDTSGTFGPTFTPPTADSGPQTIVTGPDGNLWVLEGDALQVARLTPSGVFTEFPLTAAAPGASWMAVGPDGNLWVSFAAASVLSRMTLAGEVTDFPYDTFNQSPGVTAGPDCNVWYTASRAGSETVAILRVGTGLDPGPTGAARPPPPSQSC